MTDSCDDPCDQVSTDTLSGWIAKKPKEDDQKSKKTVAPST